MLGNSLACGPSFNERELSKGYTSDQLVCVSTGLKTDSYGQIRITKYLAVIVKEDILGVVIAKRNFHLHSTGIIRFKVCPLRVHWVKHGFPIWINCRNRFAWFPRIKQNNYSHEFSQQYTKHCNLSLPRPWEMTIDMERSEPKQIFESRFDVRSRQMSHCPL